jgi:hypothetical protein
MYYSGKTNKVPSVVIVRHSGRGAVSRRGVGVLHYSRFLRRPLRCLFRGRQHEVCTQLHLLDHRYVVTRTLDDPEDEQ